MSRRLTTVAAALAVSALAWASYNAGFDMGIDTGACVAFQITTDTPIEENDFCRRSEPVEKPFLRAVRQSWLALT